MKEPYIKGLATHDDPESCAVVHKGGGSSVARAHMGSVSSREIQSNPTRWGRIGRA